MAKRRRLETPSSTDLNRIEAEFRSETVARPQAARGLAPIAQIAADAATQSDPGDAATREARARADADAARLQEADARGLLIVEIPIDQIDEGAMVRDRMAMDEEQMQELRLSIAAHGLRLPIEVFRMDEAEGQGPRFGLLSGYRRLQAVRALFNLTQAEKHSYIRALIRPQTSADAAFVAMIEENEVREELSHFERGRIAVIAADQGAFTNTEEAVNTLFATGSKAKRSKVRSFALIFEELGDMLIFPQSLSERRGLRLAGALRNGAEAALRAALSDIRPEDAEEEWAAIEAALTAVESQPRVPSSRGGRPRMKPAVGWLDNDTIRTSSGISIRRGRDGRAHILRLEGEALHPELMDSLMSHIQSLLER